MTAFASFAAGSAASLLLAAHTPALAGSVPKADVRGVELICEALDDNTLCAHLERALREHAPHLNSGSGSGTLRIGFVTERHGADVLASHLVWNLPDTPQARGPTLEISVMDHRLTDAFLRQFAEDLIRHSNLPI